MKKTLLICTLAALAAACHGDSARRDQQKYQTVQEGSASGGVTSTINAPGEVAPPMTATNADTTSNLSLPVATTGTAFGQSGSLAGTMTSTQSGSMSVPYPASGSVQGYPVAGSAPRAPQPRPAAPRSTPAPAPPMTSAAPPDRPHPSVEPQPEPQPEPVPSETSTPPAPSTDKSTSTQGTPAKPKPEPPPPPSTDTSTTTSPPPPTQT